MRFYLFTSHSHFLGGFHFKTVIPYQEFPDGKKPIKGVMELPSYAKYFKRTKTKYYTGLSQRLHRLLNDLLCFLGVIITTGC